jgi:hypothetical protein
MGRSKHAFLRRRLRRALSALALGGASWGWAACGDDAGGSDDGGSQPDIRACLVNSDCIVVPESCCGTCGAPTRGDAFAINVASASEHSRRVCTRDVGCPTCAPLFIDPTLVATCRAERCELVDLRRHEASACERDDDCTLRTPDCCECGGDTSFGRLLGIAKSAERDYADLVCDPDEACPECLPVYPSEVTVECNASQRCETNDSRTP